MLFFFACARAAAHTDILDGTAETCEIVSLDVVEADENICIHHGPSDFGILDIFASGYGHLNIIRTLESVSYYYRTAGGDSIEPVLFRTEKMLYGILAGAGIHCVAICKERFSAKFLDYIGYSLGVVGSKIGAIAEFSEMHFDGNQLALHINLGNTCSSD